MSRAYHALNLITVLLLAAWGSDVVSPLLVSFGATLGYPLVWTWLVLVRRRAERPPQARGAYARASLVLSALAWAASVLVALLFGLIWVAFRPRDASVEVLGDAGPAAGLGRVENRTQVQPEFGGGPVRRNRYVFVLEDGGRVEEIGEQAGDVGTFEVARNAALHGTRERLELVVGAFHARRSLAGPSPHWRTWEVGRSGELPTLRRLFPPLAEIKEHHADSEVWRHPSAWLQWPYITALEPAELRLEASCTFGRRELALVYRRDGFDGPWELDVEAVVAANPRPVRAPFPAGVTARLRVVRLVPAVDLLDPGPRFDEPTWPVEQGGGEVVREGVVAVEAEEDARFAHTLPTLNGPWEVEHVLRGAWSEPDGTLVLLTSEHGPSYDLVCGQPAGRWARLQHFHAEGASYLVYLLLETD